MRSLPVVGCCAGVEFWARPCVSASFTHLDVALLSLVVERVVQLASSSFSAGFIPYVAINLAWLWEEVSSESSYAAILDLLQLQLVLIGI